MQANSHPHRFNSLQHSSMQLDTHVSQYDYLQNIFDYLQNILSVYMSFRLQGNIEDVPLVRVASEVIADRRTYARYFCFGHAPDVR
jgi:hypothetical protein